MFCCFYKVAYVTDSATLGAKTTEKMGSKGKKKKFIGNSSSFYALLLCLLLRGSGTHVLQIFFKGSAFLGEN